jgi:hypothetical protein
MRNDVLTAGLSDIRGADSNTLLRMYDVATEITAGSPTLQDRARAERALRHIAKELRKRNVAL